MIGLYRGEHITYRDAVSTLVVDVDASLAVGCLTIFRAIAQRAAEELHQEAIYLAYSPCSIELVTKGYQVPTTREAPDSGAPILLLFDPEGTAVGLLTPEGFDAWWNSNQQGGCVGVGYSFVDVQGRIVERYFPHLTADVICAGTPGEWRR